MLVAIEIVDHLLKLAAHYDLEPVFESFEKQGCLDAIEDLQQLAMNQKVNDKCYAVIDWYNTLNEQREATLG